MRTNNIATLRKKVGMTQKELATHLGLAQTTVSGWERGAYEPDTYLLDKMASIFNVTIGYLMGYEESNYIPATMTEITSGDLFREWNDSYNFEDEFRSDNELQYEADREKDKKFTEHVLRQHWLNSKLPIYFESYCINIALDHMTKNERARLFQIVQLAFPNAFTRVLEGD
jgi:transcriptional regulator with XRE-family HTH domain